jgi:hypothetical protein
MEEIVRHVPLSKAINTTSEPRLGRSLAPRTGDGGLQKTLAAATRISLRHRPSRPPGTRAIARKVAVWPPSSPLRWVRVGAAARVRRRGSPARAVLRDGERCTLRIRRLHGRIWGCAEEELRLVVGWRPEPGGGDGGSGWCGGAAAGAGLRRRDCGYGRRRGGSLHR